MSFPRESALPQEVGIFPCENTEGGKCVLTSRPRSGAWRRWWWWETNHTGKTHFCTCIVHFIFVPLQFLTLLFLCYLASQENASKLFDVFCVPYFGGKEFLNDDNRVLKIHCPLNLLLGWTQFAAFNGKFSFT